MTECTDQQCPQHAGLKTRGNILNGVVVSDKMANTIIVERRMLKKDAKYERVYRARSRIPAHKPECMKVNLGDKVEIRETRKLSKTKSFVVTSVIGEQQ